MTDFVVEVSPPIDPRLPTVWLASVDGSPCVVSDRRFARVFADKDSAIRGACEYDMLFPGKVTSWAIHPK